ncbi:SGNH/GDSL hydrolase family protein [Niabella beijingensis]|uniref:SGNH/GDSL hydrolase family protein n=1 Tax=Niabella beijingensis TaxID=2872700 RepID=UPI001CC1012B|nr:GDSL-type esterase/lipase family protein [Niabella beijingensis]MBZ4192277.1 hypothetical protein [Niabella beijingensis]
MERKDFIRNASMLSLGLLGAGKVKAGDNPVEKPELIVNAGIAGNNTKNLLQRIEPDCLRHRPSLVVMMIGTNDMNHGKYVPLPKYKENLELLSDGILKSGSQLLLMTILPFYEPYLLTRHPASFFEPEGAEGRRKAVNDAIKEIARKKQTSFLDMGALFEKVGKIGLGADSLLRNEANTGKTDGVHPTRDGYCLMGVTIAQYCLYNHLPVQRVVCFGDSITKGDGSIDKESYPAYINKVLS